MEVVTFAAWSEESAKRYLSSVYSHLKIKSLRDTGKKGHPAIRGTLWKAELQESKSNPGHGNPGKEQILRNLSEIPPTSERDLNGSYEKMKNCLEHTAAWPGDKKEKGRDMSRCFIEAVLSGAIHLNRCRERCEEEQGDVLLLDGALDVLEDVREATEECTEACDRSYRDYDTAVMDRLASYLERWA